MPSKSPRLTKKLINECVAEIRAGTLPIDVLHAKKIQRPLKDAIDKIQEVMGGQAEFIKIVGPMRQAFRKKNIKMKKEQNINTHGITNVTKQLNSVKRVLLNNGNHFTSDNIDTVEALLQGLLVDITLIKQHTNDSK